MTSNTNILSNGKIARLKTQPPDYAAITLCWYVLLSRMHHIVLVNLLADGYPSATTSGEAASPLSAAPLPPRHAPAADAASRLQPQQQPPPASSASTYAAQVSNKGLVSGNHRETIPLPLPGRVRSLYPRNCLHVTHLPVTLTWLRVNTL